MSRDIEALWGKLESASKAVPRPLPPHKVLFSSHTQATSLPQARFRPIPQTNDPLKYGIPVEKYTSALISDRTYQGQILSSEFALLGEKLKLLSERLQVKGELGP